jgi:hypothetical protein
MQQIRVPLASVEAVFTELMAGHWNDVARSSGVSILNSAD